MKWTFIESGLGRARNSQVEKFFKSDAVADRATAVIREGIQNSLDASKGTPVRVRIALGSIPAAKMRPYCDGLFPHLDAVRKKFPHIPMAGDEVPYLVFEDFNTKGLTGDAEQWKPIEKVKNPFFNFFRGEGVTDKSDGARGRHGVGKMVFTVASNAHCIFGLTATDDAPPRLMGTSTLELHECGETSYTPDGWFGSFKAIPGMGNLVVPTTDSSAIETFCSTFDIKRTTETGLSIVVPWRVETLNRNAVVSAVVVGYFWPILKGELIVEINSTSEDSLTIDVNSLRTVVEQSEFEKDFEPILKLAEWARSHVDSPDVTVSAPQENKAQKWTPELIAVPTRDAINAILAQPQPVAVRFPLQIRPKDPKEKTAATWFQIALQSCSQPEDSRVIFIRKGLIVSAVRPRRTPGFSALVIIEDEPLAKFLGDAENPAHTEWLKENVKEDYLFAPSCLEYVVECVPNLIKALNEQDKKSDPTLLLDLFSVPVGPPESPTSKGSGPKPKPGQTPPPSFPDGVKTKPRRFIVSQKGNGFVVGKGEKGAPTPRILTISAAYLVRRGNPFKKYRPADFQFQKAPISCEFESASLVEMTDNVMKVAVDGPDFKIQLRGFDSKRDLCVDVKAKDEEANDAEET